MIKERHGNNYFTHGFHPYPAKFAPSMVGKFLEYYCAAGDVVLDLFCGSGTAPVECSLRGMDSVGIDLNPVACLISRAKTNKYMTDDITNARNFVTSIRDLAEDAAITKNHTLSNKLLPDLPNREHWFQDNVSRELALLKERIDNVKNPNLRDLLFCAFSKIIVKVSNQDSEVRYTAKNKNHPDKIVFSAFVNAMDSYLEIITDPFYSINGTAKVYNGDATTILEEIPANYFDFVVTSPPYINTFDYYLYHKQRMLWMGFDYHPVRRQEIGNHHRIDSKSIGESKAEYIDSMTRILFESSRVSKPNSRFVMIIGDGTVKGETIDMYAVIAKICGHVPYIIEQVEKSCLADTTKSFNRRFSRAAKNEHTITLRNIK